MLDHRLDHCGGYSVIQQPAELDCKSTFVYCLLSFFSLSNQCLLQSALFASWFSCEFSLSLAVYRCILTVAVGLGGIYWLHLNWGRLFSSPRKIALTIINVLIVGIGATIVSSVRSSRL